VPPVNVLPAAPRWWRLPRPRTNRNLRPLPGRLSPRTFRPDGVDQDPFRILKFAIAGILAFATLVAVALWATGAAPRALVLVGAFWALYGLFMASIDGVLEPVIDLAVTALQNAGLSPHRSTYSSIETLEARGLYEAAAAEYLERAHQDGGDAYAMIRRARLLAGHLSAPEAAVMELENYRESRRLTPGDDIRLGLELASLYERRLDVPGKAMRELRRLLDLHPSARGLRHIRRNLAALRAERFDHPSDTP